MNKDNNISDLGKLKQWIVRLVKEAVKKYLNTNNIWVTVSLSDRVIITIRYNTNTDQSKIQYLYDLNNHSNGFFTFKPINKDIVYHDIAFRHISVGFYPNEDRNNLFYKVGQLIGILDNTNGVSYINSAILDFKQRDKDGKTFVLSLNKKEWFDRDIKYTDLELLDKQSYKALNNIAVKYEVEYPARYTMFIKNGWVNKVNNPAKDRYLKNNPEYCNIVKKELVKIINDKKTNAEPLDIYNLKDYKLLDAEEDFYRNFEDLELFYKELGLEPFKISYDNDFNSLNGSIKRTKELIRLVYSLH